MNLSNELTQQINTHLDEVRKYLGTLPPDERQEILQSIESHIYDALETRSDGEPTPALLDAVIAEMDPPESYGELPSAKRPKSVMKPLVSVAVVLMTTLGIWVAFEISKENTPANTLTAAESKRPPIIVSTFPQNGNNAVDPDITELRVTFNKDMLTDRMWSWCIESQDTSPKFASTGTKFIDNRTCITPVELEPNKTYVVWINTQKRGSFRDINHNPAVPYRLEFKTGNVQSLIASIPDKSKDSVEISSITPHINKDLISGETAIFEVEVEYNLITSDTASITLVIQRSESGHRPLANETAVIKRGKGKITISTEVKIPDTKAIQLFTPLSVPGSMQTTVVDSRAYKVKR